MIIDLPSTTTAAVNRKLVDLRDSGGAIALGRVLTLVIVTDEGECEESIAAANDASREHPCRVIVIVEGNRRGAERMDAQVRIGGDAGASEVIVLRLYGQLAEHADSVVTPLLLPDSPLVGLVAGAGAQGAGQGPGRADGPAQDHRRGRRLVARARSSCADGTPTRSVTRTWRGPGSPSGAGCSPRRSTSRRTTRSSTSP